MGFIQTADVEKLMTNGDLAVDIAKAVIDDADAMDSLVSDIADEMGDALSDDTELKRQIIEAAIANDEFKKRLVQKLVEDLDD